MGNTIEHCEGCDRIDGKGDCAVYASPASQMKWVDTEARIGCAFNSKKYIKDKVLPKKVRVGQQKQRKR